VGELRQRAFELAVGDMKLTGHQVQFKVEKTLKPDPNTAEISIYNLTDNQRSKISQLKTPLVRLAAGYAPTGVPDLTQIFYGQCIHVEHEFKDNGDVATHLTTGDGITAYQKARIAMSFGAKTKIETVLRALVKQLGLRPGNVDSIARELSGSLTSEIYIGGTVLSGSVSSELTALSRSAGLEWSIQDGAVQLLNRNKALDKFAIVLSPETGLVGSPSVSNKGIISGTCKIIKDFTPGRQIEVKARWVKGRARLEKVIYTGDRFGDDWDCAWEAKGALTEAGAKITARKKVGS
jgi:hypothetical protein